MIQETQRQISDPKATPEKDNFVNGGMGGVRTILGQTRHGQDQSSSAPKIISKTQNESEDTNHSMKIYPKHTTESGKRSEGLGVWSPRNSSIKQGIRGIGTIWQSLQCITHIADTTIQNEGGFRGWTWWVMWSAVYVVTITLKFTIFENTKTHKLTDDTDIKKGNGRHRGSDTERGRGWGTPFLVLCSSCTKSDGISLYMQNTHWMVNDRNRGTPADRYGEYRQCKIGKDTKANAESKWRGHSSTQQKLHDDRLRA